MSEPSHPHSMPAASIAPVPVAELPNELRKLTDPATPLPTDWLLIGHGLAPILPSSLKCAGALISALVFALPIAATAGALGWIYAAIALSCLVYGVFPARRAWAAIRDRLAFQAGTWRRGLHLGPRQLLLWDGQTGVVVDRAKVDQLKRVETQRPSVNRSARPIVERRCVLSVRQPEGSSVDLELPMIEAGAADASPAPASWAALERWIADEAQTAPGANPNELRGWARNAALGHAVLLGASLIGMLGTALIAYTMGIATGALLGLLLGFPLFIGFPLLLRASVGRFLARGEDDRPIGWAYFMSLGLAGMILIIIGSNLAGELLWQFRASESPPLSVSEIAASNDSLRFYPWTKDLVPSATITGYQVHRRYLGDAQWIESSYYVALLDEYRGCVWLGLQTGEGATSRRSLSRLLNERASWLAPAVGLERSGYAKAIEDARTEAAGAVPSCEKPLVLEASASLAQRRVASLGQLALITALAHGLPLLALLIWGLWRVDSRPKLRHGQRQ